MREPEKSNGIFSTYTMSEMPDADQWGVRKESAHRLSLRNTGRIEQPEAGQEEIKEWVASILRAAAGGAIYERSRWKWDSPTDLEDPRQAFVHMGFHGPALVIGTCEGARGEWVAPTDIQRDWVYSVHSWAKSGARLSTRAVVRELVEMETPSAERILEVARLFSELKEDFEDVGIRISRCALLEEALGALEDELEDEEAEYLAWCVSLLRDVLDYNYSEDISRDSLDVMGRGIEMICTKQVSCDRADYQKLHEQLMATGLDLLPTSRKAGEKYGEKESSDGGERLLFP